MGEITFRVSLDQANLILEGLGQLAFARVYNLVAELQEQAARQLNDEGAKQAPLKREGVVPQLGEKAREE